MINRRQSIAVYAFAKRMLTLFSSDETLLPRYVNVSINFRGLPLVEMALSRLKYMYFVLFAFMWRPIPPTAYSRLCSRDSAWVGVFIRSALSSA